MTTRFKTGDTVRILEADPPGHRRVPVYVRGKTGTIERYCGDWANPEDLAYGLTGLPKRPLYRVRLKQTDLWPDYDGSPDDMLELEIYEHWLQPA